MIVRLRTVVAVVGSLTLAFAAGLVHTPWLFSDAAVFAVETVSGVDPLALLAGIVGLVVGVALLKLFVTRFLSPRPGPFVEDPPELPQETDTRVVGEQLDRAIRSGATDRVVDELREAAVTVRMRKNGVDRETAVRDVARGTWTEDARAAALLGEHAPPPPVHQRVRDWVAGDTREKRIRHALDEIESAWNPPEETESAGVGPRPAGDGGTPTGRDSEAGGFRR